MSTAKPRPQTITHKPKVASLREYVFSEYIFYYWRMGVGGSKETCLYAWPVFLKIK